MIFFSLRVCNFEAVLWNCCGKIPHQSFFTLSAVNFIKLIVDHFQAVKKPSRKFHRLSNRPVDKNITGAEPVKQRYQVERWINSNCYDIIHESGIIMHEASPQQPCILICSYESIPLPHSHTFGNVAAT